jgi:hypothetical protein
MSETMNLKQLSGTAISDTDHERFHLEYIEGIDELSLYDHPHSVFVQPVYEKLNEPDAELVGMICATVPWDRYLANLLPIGVNGIMAVLENSCGQTFTYAIRGDKVRVICVLSCGWRKLSEPFLIVRDSKLMLYYNRQSTSEKETCTIQPMSKQRLWFRFRNYLGQLLLVLRDTACIPSRYTRLMNFATHPNQTFPYFLPWELPVSL